MQTPDRSIGRLDILSAAERSTILSVWNATEHEIAPQGAPATLPQLFAAQAARTPAATAVMFEGRALSYAELDAHSNQLAHHLRGLGVGPETVVGLCVERSPEMVVGLLGILKAGGAYLPLDPAYPAERLSFMLADARAAVLVTQAALAERLPMPGRSRPPARVVRLDADWAEVARRPTHQPAVATDPEHPAYVIYTSGSTGTPKGVVVTQEALSNFLAAMQERFALTADDRLLAVTTIGFDIAALELYLPLISGAVVVLTPREVVHDPRALRRTIAATGATIMHATPTLWQALMAEVRAEDLAGLAMLVGGEALTGELRALRCASQGRAVDQSAMARPRRRSVSCDDRDHRATAQPPIGRPIWNTRVYVLDGGLEAVPAGVVGELYISGAGLARGYLGRSG